MRSSRLIFAGAAVGLATSTMGIRAIFEVIGSGPFTLSLRAQFDAIVLNLLATRRDNSAGAGRAGVLIPDWRSSDGAACPVAAGRGSAFGIVWRPKAVAIIAVVLVFARRLMPKMLEVVARTCSPELFLLTVIAFCFGTAYLTSLAGVSLSLGAFLAGLLVSESRFSEHALSEIMPLQILFSATFRLVGMLLDLNFLVRNLRWCSPS